MAFFRTDCDGLTTNAKISGIIVDTTTFVIMTNAGVIISHSFTTSNTMEIIISFVPSENVNALKSEKRLFRFK